MVGTLNLSNILWLVICICIVVVISVITVAVVIWWLSKAYDDKSRAERYRVSSSSFAGCADEWLTKYYKEKEDHADTIDFYTGALERKDRKIESLIEWDEKKTERISQLEKQLADNGIKPDKWEFVA